MSATIRRRRGLDTVTTREVSCELRFTDGLVIDGVTCPINNLARSHWHHDPAGGDRGVCSCELAGQANPNAQEAHR